MARKPLTSQSIPPGIDRANIISIEKNFAELYAKIATLEANLAAATKASNSGSSIYVAGSDTSPFVAGPSIGAGKVLITDPDGNVREAVDGRDFYWDRDAQPVFFKDLEVVSVTRVGGNSEYYPNGGLPPNRPGYISTNYNNGFSTLEEIPLAEWNPPLAAVGQLPDAQARALLNEYMDSRGLTFMTQGGTDELGSWLSDDYRSFLVSKGITGSS